MPARPNLISPVRGEAEMFRVQFPRLIPLEMREALTRNVLILASCQAVFQTGLVLIMTVGGLAGHLLATDKALATVPIAAMMLGTTLALIPASLLMARIGRRNGFALGTLLGAAGGAVAVVGLLANSFSVFCLGHVFLGAYQGFAQYYRFAAVDAARPESRSRAISLVIAGGVVAAIAGPQLAILTKDFSASGPFVASYGALVGLSLAATALVALLDIPAPLTRTDRESARPLSVIVRQPAFLVALGGAAVGWGVMYLAMTPMPLAMVGDHHALSDAAFVLQWHVLAMSVPSFFTGALIARFGAPHIMLAGIALLAGNVIIALSGIDIVHYLSALVLLGVGWNFAYIGGTALLTETYSPAEKAKAQAVNDFVIFGVMVIASLASGGLFEFFGWRGVNLGAIPFILLAATTIALFSLTQRSKAQPDDKSQ
jgi:MFS family permease